MSRPKSYSDPRITTALRLPVDLHGRLKAEADGRDVSVNWLITRAIERYLDDIYEQPLNRDKTFTFTGRELAAMLKEEG